MRRALLVAASCFMCVLLALPLLAAKHTVVRRLPMPMTAPLFLESETYSSTLYLVNALTFGVDASVTIYDMSGLLLTTKHYYIEPNAQRAIAIKHVLADGGIFSQVGSVEVVSPQNSNALLGQLSITRTGSNPTYLDEELFMPNAKGSAMQRAVIDSPQNSPIVAITNVSTTAAQVVHTQCIPSTGAPIDKLFTLQSKQTQLVRACSTVGDAVIDPDAMDGQFTFATKDGSGMAGKQVAGVTITGDGPPSDLAAFGFVEHNDEYGRYFSAMNFTDPSLLASTGSVYTGLPIGKSRLLPATIYTPQVAVTNFSDSPKAVYVSLATTLSGVSDRHQVSSFTIPAHSSQMQELTGLTGDADWKNSFVVTASGKPGDVLSKMAFRGAGPLSNVELIPKDELSPYTAGDHPWSVENGTRSTLFLFNHSTMARSVTVRLGTAGATWLKIYDLTPNETRAISINDIQAQKTPDMDGKTLSAAAVDGEVGWWAPADGSPQMTGRIVQIDSLGTMARNFSCRQFINVCIVNATPNPIVLTYGASSPVTVASKVTYCADDQPESCVDTGQYTTNQSKTVTWSWNSENTSIAQISSGASSQNSSWQGMNFGNTMSDVTVVISGGGQSCEVQGPVTVNACPVPDGDSTKYVQQAQTGLGVPTVSDFLQTLNVTGSDDGASITEGNNAAGTDSCYFTNSAIQKNSGISGGTWTIGGVTANAPESKKVIPGHNQWGPDMVGWTPAAITYYQQNEAKQGKSLPCSFTTSQSLAITCANANTSTVYKANVPLTGTIDSTGTTVCRDSVCAPHYKYP